jgi:hypothetical protein
MSTMDARGQAFVVHLTRHRIRIKIPRRERQEAYFVALKPMLETHPDIVSVRVNALVASIVIHCRDGFEITSLRNYFIGLELVVPASGSPTRPQARQIASDQRILGRSGSAGSTSSICLVSLMIKLTIAVATKQFEALIREWIAETVVRVLLRQLYRHPTPRLEAPRALLVAAGE